MKCSIARFFAIWLFLGSLFPQTDAVNHCKLAVLFSHEHTNTNQHMEDSIAHEDEKDNSTESCPFQTHACGCHSVIFLPIECAYNLPVSLMYFENHDFQNFEQNHYRFQPENALFSPPKFLFV